MRVLKPDTLAFLRKVIRDEQGFILCSTVLAGFVFDTAAPGRWMAEKDLWAVAAAALGPDEALDAGLPKPEAEFLVYGACRVPRAAKAAQVRVSVAERVKTLDVYGHRAWLDGRAGDPAPFTAMPVDWAHAYGGPDFPENPLGRGRARDAQGMRPLPNILPAGVAPVSPDEPCPPAGLTALAPHWPQRARHLGPFDQAWLADRWPHQPRGTSPQYALAAPADQRMGRFFTGGEPVVIHNMHPAIPRLSTTLPAPRLRFFLNRRDGGREVFTEWPCRADTLWLFPDRLAGILAWRSLSRIADEDMEDVGQALIAMEAPDTPPLSLGDYLSVLAAHLPRPGRPAAPESTPSGPPPEPASQAPPPEPAPPPPPQTPPEAAAAMDAAVAELNTEVDTQLAKLGVSREQATAAFAAAAAASAAQTGGVFLTDSALSGQAGLDASMAELATAAEALERQVGEQLARAGLTEEESRATLARMAQTTPQDPVAAMDAMLAHPDLPKEARAKFLEARQAFGQLAQALAELEKSVPKLPPGPAEPPDSVVDQARKPGPEPTGLAVDQIMAKHARGESLAGLDLRGLDFSGRELAGADFTCCRLDNAVFCGADLTGARFVKARLDHARLDKARAAKASFVECQAPKAVFAAADLSGASLIRADLTGADFSTANLAGAVLDAATLAGAVLAGAQAQGMTGRRTDFSAARLAGADLRRAVLDDAILERADCAGTDFRQASAPRLRLHGAKCPGARFKEAFLHNARADQGADLTGADLRRADLTMACLDRARLSGADARRAVLVRASLVRADLVGARLCKADAREAVFDKADLSRADLTKINGLMASFRKARLVGCILKKANLFSANLYKCVLGDTVLAGANCGRTVLDTRVITRAR